jgi:hypothetical protein
MSILQRKTRPIPTRDKDPSRLRDDLLFIVACDDRYAPKQYFGFLELTRVKIHVVPAEDNRSVAEAVLDKLLTYDYVDGDERWMLLDTDHVTSGTHLKSFLPAINRAKRRGIKIALSKPCFELWLLLHHADVAEVSIHPDASAVELALRAAIGEYNKTNLKAEHYPIARIAQAIERARSLDMTVKGGTIPKSNTTRVYQLLEAIAAKASPLELPEELRGIHVKTEPTLP